MDLLDKIIEAKEKIGDDAAIKIADYLKIENFSEEKLKGSCPFGHSDSTPSFIWDRKDNAFKCFSCGRRYSIVDMYTDTEGSYFKALKRLFSETGVEFNLKEVKQDRDEFFKNYVYPTEETNTNRDKVESYLNKRGISNRTLDYAGIKQDKYGNIVFESRDVDDTLLSVKYRKAGKVRKGEPKMWYQKNASNCPILYNINKIDITKPLLITEGECYSGDTEILTPNGWVRFDEYDNQLVMQVDENMNGNFVMPIAYVNKEYSGNMCYKDSRTHKVAVTENHNMVYYNNHGSLVKKKAVEMPKNIGSGYIPNAINFSGDGIDLDYDQISLYIAVCVNGNVKFGGNKEYIEYHTKSKAGYIWIKTYLNVLGIEYTENESKTIIKFDKPDWIKDNIIPQEWFYKSTTEQKRFIINEFIDWYDSNDMKVVFNSHTNADNFQKILATCGYGSYINKTTDELYCVDLKSNYGIKFQKGWDSIEYYSGKVYCVTVPTGMILIRHRGVISVCGNCDTLSCIESGFTNTVSIPHGASDTSWIEFNYDFLEKFEEIILWFDNDKAGQLAINNTVSRLGEYRCKLVNPDKEYEDAVEKYYKTFDENITVRKTDANNILLACGNQSVLSLINSADEIPSKRLKYLMDCEMVDVKDMEKVSTGFRSLDKILYGNLFPCFSIITGYAGCVDADTEFFDGTKWKRIADYKNGDKVLEYDIENDRAVLSYPLDYIKKECDVLYTIGGHKGIKMTLSPEHNVLWYDRDNNPHETMFSDIMIQHNRNTYGFNGKIKGCFNYSGSGIELTDEQIKLMCAIICDGSFYSNIKNPEAKSYMTCRFHIKKERKKEKLRELFKECNLQHREVESANDGYTDFYIQAPRREKEFTDYWYNCNQHQLKVICDNILFWDGYKSKTSDEFSTSNKKTADFVQFAFSSCNRIATIQTLDRVGKKRTCGGKTYKYKSVEYCVTINKKQYYGFGGTTYGKNKSNIVPEKTKDGYKYCFTMPMGTLVLRKNNRIFTSFNSGKSSLANIMSVIYPIENGYKTFIFSGELSEGQLLNWVISPLAGYNHTIEWNNNDDGSKGYSVTKEAEKKIREFYRKSIILYSDDNELDTSGEAILNEMENAYRRYGCKVFLIDNLMCINFEDLDGNDSKWASQKQFIIKLMKFTNKYGVNVNLILHPRKPNQSQSQTVYDLHGASEIGNLCHRMLWINRLKDDPAGFNIEIKVIKDRPTGKGNESVKMNYDTKTHRIYSDSFEQKQEFKWEESSNIQYSDFVKNKLICNLPDDNPNPQECDQF